MTSKDSGPDQGDENPDFGRLRTELEAFELMTAGYVGSITRAARLFPDDKWNWSFSERTPTAREVCEHTFAWLWWDRQQVCVPDPSFRLAPPQLPADRTAMISKLTEEGREWRRLARSLTPAQLLEERETGEGERWLVRSLLFHMGQHVVYKAGQIWMLAFELGLDGSEPYTAPYPQLCDDSTESEPWPFPRR